MPNVAEAPMPWWGTPVVEQFRAVRVPDWLGAASSIIAAITGTVTIMLWLTGALAGSSIINSRLATLSDQMTQMQADLRSVPRADQIIVLDRHLSAQDGRMDGIDTRLRDIENRTAALQARVDLIDQSSHASLGRK